MSNPEETLKEVQGKLEPCYINTKTEGILYPKEHIIKQAMLNKLFIVDDTLLDKPEPDYAHFEFMMQSISPMVWEGCNTYLDVLRTFWTELSPYMKKLVINCEVANNGINAVEKDMQDLLSNNASMIHFLKLEGLFDTYKDFRQHQKDQQESSGEDI